MDNNNHQEDNDHRKNDKKKQTIPEHAHKQGKNLTSTTSLGKRRSLDLRTKNASTKRSPIETHQSERHDKSPSPQANNKNYNKTFSTMSDPHSSEYGSQATPLRVPIHRPNDKLNKVSIIGASGGIGQPLGLLLMQHSEYIQHLALYDVAPVTKGVGMELGHIDRQCIVTTHVGLNELPEAVHDANVIVIVAGIAQKPGMSRDDLFGVNSKIMLEIANVCARNAPEAFLAIVSNPVNSLVPLVHQVYERILGNKNQNDTKQCKSSHLAQTKSIQSPVAKESSKKQLENNTLNPSERPNEGELPCWARRIFGVTTLDVIRSSTLVAKSHLFTQNQDKIFKDPARIFVPVVGGHAGKTIIPLLSRTVPKIEKRRLTEDFKTTSKLIESIQEAGIEVLNAKKSAGTATLSMAHAACRFVISLLRAQADETNINECAYVRLPTPIGENLDYFALPLQLTKHGYVNVNRDILDNVLPYEHQMIEDAIKLLKVSVTKGQEFARDHINLLFQGKSNNDKPNNETN